MTSMALNVSIKTRLLCKNISIKSFILAAKAKKTDGPLMNSTVTKYNKEDFILPTDEDGSERYNLKISSWNVAGLRSWLKKDGLRFLKYELPDIFCLQVSSEIFYSVLRFE